MVPVSELSWTQEFDRRKYTTSDFNGKFRYAASTMRGWRKSQEDRFKVDLDLPAPKGSPSSTNAYFGVFDGHRGYTLAEYASQTLHEVLIASPDYTEDLSGNETGLKRAFTDSFVAIDDDVRCQRVLALEREEEDRNYPQKIGDPTISGCTATIALCDETRIWTANAGDSRALLFRGGRAQPLTKDHTPHRPEEWKRIVDEGWFVRAGKILGVLNISRTLGDTGIKFLDRTPDKQPVCCIPEVCKTPIDQEDEFMVLVTDGVWNALRNRAELTKNGLKTVDPEGNCLRGVSVPSDGPPPKNIAQAYDKLDDADALVAVNNLGPEQTYALYQTAEADSNQNMCDAVRWCIAQRLPLEMICECILEFGLSNYHGNDNMTIIIVPILHGRTLEQWYAWMVKRIRESYGSKGVPSKFPVYESRGKGSLDLDQIVAQALGK
ncbi:protein serine/threonine phosphatase 2C [Dacryopinax primogenitus]|uniref:Protein serine/threonine phosphatase 2C n=1 Tax=Dacryopinax primogenitus (strain DJM 731) TaxID=1858805 RepID=M5GH52_DACPD|nr:protein serine/threonine phosphatase 2C [Dacryopinax primogenitus]EJU06633.1 protein serine/threonine phosphatase 2C [Dacryopinax primogenitus]